MISDPYQCVRERRQARLDARQVATDAHDVCVGRGQVALHGAEDALQDLDGKSTDAYGAKVTEADGTHVEILLNKDFAITGEKAMSARPTATPTATP